MSAPANKVSPLRHNAADSIELPAWVSTLVGDAPTGQAIVRGLPVQTRSDDQVSLVSVRVAGANSLAARDFEHATANAYLAIAGVLARVAAGHPVRFWNFIPSIHAAGDADTSIDRYMIFNAGRYAACKQWLGGEDAFARLLATASGVGHTGDDLVIHALAADAPGVAVENPRQVPAYCYSRRYGPCPPCFARATRVRLRGVDRVLIGGTASVRGEESVHVGDLRRQIAETLDNLAALLQAATNDDAGPHLLSDVRVYHVRPDDAPAIDAIARLAFPAATIEYVRADICRQDLLVEIEGVAGTE